MRAGTSIALTIVLTALFLGDSACGTGSKRAATPAASGLTEDERHRLYSAALAASESPLDTETFRDVCKRIGIFDASGQPNENYMSFVGRHVDWGLKSQTDDFRREIDSKEKARDYLRQRLHEKAE